jgi:hypothetical protein
MRSVPVYPSINGAGLAENRYFVDVWTSQIRVPGPSEARFPWTFSRRWTSRPEASGPEYGGPSEESSTSSTRSGSNELHGSLFGFYKNDSLTSNPPANVRNEQLLATRDYEAGARLEA